MASTGEVWLVGAGPGDPGLLTLRGREVLERADVVVHDRLVNPALLGLAPRARHIDVGKSPDGHGYRQEEINGLLVELAREGNLVVRLKGGDPFIFGRGGEEALALVQAGIPFRVVPGVTAASGCAAWAGVPLTHRGLASSLTLVTGHEDPGKPPQVNWQRLAAGTDTLVVYMGVGRLEVIVSELLAGGRPPGEPALLVREGTRAGQRVLSSALWELPARAAEAGVGPPALLVVGKVAALRQRLAWYEDLPLAGCRIALTRPRLTFARPAGGGGMPSGDWEMGPWWLAGAEVGVYHLLRLQMPPDPGPLRRAVLEVGRFRFVLFTSAPGVEAFFLTLHGEGRDARSLAGCRLGAVGPGTAAALRRYGLVADLVPRTHTVEDLVREVAARIEPGDRVLLPRSDLAPSQAEVLRRAGAGEVREVAAYHAVPDEDEAARLARDVRAREVDVLVFTSASAVRVAAARLAPGEAGMPQAQKAGESAVGEEFPLVVAIGPVTAAACRQAGWEPDAEAANHDRAGLLQAAVEAWRRHRPGSPGVER